MTDYFTAEQVYQSLKEENAALKKFCHEKQAENETLRMGYAAARLEIESLQRRVLDAAFEAVRKKICALPRYSFVLDDDGLIRRVQDRVGNWIEFDEAHALFDPVSVDAARKQGGA